MEIVSRWQSLPMGGPFIHVGLLRILSSMVNLTYFGVFSHEFLWNFLDTYTSLTAQDGSSTYNFSQSGIAWPGEAKKYTSRPDYPFDQIVPPPNWSKRFPDGYSNSTPPPDLRADEHFQNWMRTSGLPAFTKLWGRNDGDTLKKGTYIITVDLSMCIFVDRKVYY
jgi:hypothetical protein